MTTATTTGKCPFQFDRALKKDTYPEAAAQDSKTGVISNLSNPRSSDGMGLPTAMCPATLETVTATAPVVGPKALTITKTFYKNVIGAAPGLLQWFNPAHNVPNSDHQPKALAGSVVAYATNIQDLAPLLVEGGPVAAICHRHCALGIFPGQYVVVHEFLMKAIGEVLGEIVTPEIGGAWSEAVLFLAKAMIDTEESVYKLAERRSGGWSGFAEFEVSEITEMTADVKKITFRPPKGSPLEQAKFEFTNGQYLSLQIDMDGDNLSAPRHYTATSPPMAEYLSCTIKHVPGGKLSTYVHTQLQVGDKVTLSAPFGVYVEPKEDKTATVLMSAGIGVTPMVNLYKSTKTDVKLIVHVDKTPEGHPYKSYFDDETDGTETLFKYSKSDGRVSAEDLVAQTLEKSGTENDFYICGPEKWMDAIQQELQAKGARKVICEVFGSQLATGCPFFA